MARVYFHIDLNAFFANAEVLLDPSLKGKPLVVSGNTRRSVVSTASYEARAFGIHSAMPISEAQQLCKDLVVVEHHFHWYQELSNQFLNIIRRYTTEIEQASIDECYADVTETIMKYEKPLDLAWEIQRKILQEIHLPCSIGVAPNMFLAKMASDMKKPMGITVLRIREVEQKLWPLPISDMRGVGKKTLPYLLDLNINTIGDLARYQNIEELRSIFGKNTEFMISRANGHDDRMIVKEYDSKSMGVSETLLEDITDYDELRGVIRQLSRTLSNRLFRDKKAGLSISVRIRYYDFTNIDRSKKLNSPIWKSDDLYVQAMSIFDENYEEGDAVRLLGLSVSDFEENHNLLQMNLFDQEESLKEETTAVIRQLNQELGGLKLTRASELKRDED